MADVYCRDHGDNPECLGEVDPQYTMDYTDVEGGGYIYWCSNCGPLAHAMEKAINHAFATRPGFAEDLKDAIERAQLEESRAQLEKALE